MPSKLELKPCPFCGGKASFVDDGHYGFCECSDCGAKSGGYVFDDTVTALMNRNATVREQWNKRTQ
jgi:Lar family restriction alleviation protein